MSEDILKAITIVADHLEKAANEIRGLVKEQIVTEIAKVDEVQQLFPADLESMLAFEDTEGYFIARPRRFLGSENFAKIASIVRDAGGEYISAGKESHFRFKK